MSSSSAIQYLIELSCLIGEQVSVEDYLSLSAGHGRRILSLDLSHSGSMVLAATDDQTVAVFKSDSGREPRVRIGDERSDLIHNE